ncbi:MAG TPA: methyltransferase domain-containing protein [Candidatus Limnocylindria bacterium]|nr:methyltransferase domain-containing protein [Candidatus Limnocylindria bacterium]
MRADEVYARRFPEAEARAKDALWREIARWLQRFVPRDAVVLDLACDRGYFIRNIAARERWATDLRDMRADVGEDVHFVRSDGLRLAEILPRADFDVAFTSNYLEHLPSADAVVEQLRVMRGLLKPGGRAIVLQPNVALVGGVYWDFIDHKVALTDRSLVEAAELAGLRTERVIRRFLPYSTKGRLPRAPALVRAYLAFPPAWALLGKQTLYVGTRE